MRAVKKNNIQIARRGAFTIFSPMVFIILFILSFILYTMHLSRSMSYLNDNTAVYVALCIVTFLLGWAIAHIRIKLSSNISDAATPYRWLWPIFIICMAAYVFEYIVFIYKFGNVPIALPDYEKLRFEFPVSGYIHLVAMAIRSPILYIYAYYAKYSLPTLSKYCLFLSILLVSALDFMQGVRGAMVLFLVSLVVIHSAYRKIGWKVAVFVILALVFVGAAKTVREYEAYGSSSIASVERDSELPGGFIGVSLYHLYMAFAFNFSMLNQYVAKLDHHFYGYFTIVYGLASLAPGKQYDLVDLQHDVLGSKFDAALTATMLSYPYFDFGYMGCIVVGALGWFVQTIYLKAKESKSLRHVAVYSYLFTNMALGIYTYTFSEIYVQLSIFLLMWGFPYYCGLFVSPKRSR